MHGARALLWAALALVLLAAGPARAAAPDIHGWEPDSPYGKLYDPAEKDRIKGVIADIVDIVPMPGMAPGVGLAVTAKAGKAGKGGKAAEAVTVHLGPKSFIDLAAAGVRKGDEVKISGAWAELGGKDVFLAAKIKKGEQTEFKLRRTSDGKPYWAMSPEEMDQAKSSDTAELGW
jgi:hypothetical protein